MDKLQLLASLQSAESEIFRLNNMVKALNKRPEPIPTPSEGCLLKKSGNRPSIPFKPVRPEPLEKCDNPNKTEAWEYFCLLLGAFVFTSIGFFFGKFLK